MATDSHGVFADLDFRTAPWTEAVRSLVRDLTTERCMEITVVTPTIPPRREMLKRALDSVIAQTYPAAAISTAVDLYRDGAPKTRQRALDAVRTEWTALLDDDDQMLPHHLATLSAWAKETDADYVYAWYYPVGFDVDPLPHFGKEFDPAHPTQTTITILVRTELAKEIGFRDRRQGAKVSRHGEDFQFTVDCLEAGAKISHVPERTWIWNYSRRNTQGLSWLW